MQQKHDESEEPPPPLPHSKLQPSLYYNWSVALYLSLTSWNIPPALGQCRVSKKHISLVSVTVQRVEFTLKSLMKTLECTNLKRTQLTAVSHQQSSHNLTVNDHSLLQNQTSLQRFKTQVPHKQIQVHYTLHRALTHHNNVNTHACMPVRTNIHC